MNLLFCALENCKILHNIYFQTELQSCLECKAVVIFKQFRSRSPTSKKTLDHLAFAGKTNTQAVPALYLGRMTFRS